MSVRILFSGLCSLCLHGAVIASSWPILEERATAGIGASVMDVTLEEDVGPRDKQSESLGVRPASVASPAEQPTLPSLEVAPHNPPPEVAATSLPRPPVKVAAKIKAKIVTPMPPVAPPAATSADEHGPQEVNASSASTHAARDAAAPGEATSAGISSTAVGGYGGGSSAPDYLQNPPPRYPTLSRRLGEEGVVLLRVTITSEGDVRELIVKTSSEFPRLDSAAKEAVRSWHFKPATRHGVPVEDVVDVPIRFRLVR